MIRELIQDLYRVGLEPTAEEVADILWLASQVQTSQATSIGEDIEQTNVTAQGADPQSKTEETLSDPSDVQENRQATEQSETDGEEGGGLFLPDEDSIEDSESGWGGEPFQTPAAPALPAKLALARALRPLKRQVNSRLRYELDIEATIRLSADSQSLVPVEKPTTTRWLDLILVVDEWSSMVIWQQTIEELRRMLAQQGAFRNIMTWGFTTDPNSERIQLHYGVGPGTQRHRRRNPEELLDPSGETLILVISDCISPAWYNGQVTQLLETWSEYNGLITLVQMLPERLWTRTALRRWLDTPLRSTQAGTPNLRLDMEWPRRWRRREKPKQILKMPVITLQPESLQPWALSMVGSEGLWITGRTLLLDPNEELEQNRSYRPNQRPVPKHQTSMERLDHFWETASPTARKLAGYFAAAPLSLPTMRLVQHVMLKEARQVHLAEVFLSGLIRHLTKFDPDKHPDDFRYDFLDDDMRRRLLEGVYVNDRLEVLDRVAHFVDKRTGQTLSFRSILAVPILTDHIEFKESSLSFAMVAATVLKSLGRSYEALTQRLHTIAAGHSTVVNVVKPSVEPESNGPATEASDSFYLNFDLKIESIDTSLEKVHLPSVRERERKPSSRELYLASVLDSPVGMAKCTFTWPLSPIQLENHILEMGLGIDNNGSSTEQASKRFGSILFDALFQEEIYTCLLRSLAAAKEQQYSLYIRLSLDDAPELVDIPWEFLYDPERENFLALSSSISFVRRLVLPQRILPLSVTPPLRILVMIANPRDYGAIDVEQEWLHIQRAVADLALDGLLEIELLSSATLSALQQQLYDQEYHILHFVGHSGFDAQSQESGLLLEDDQGLMRMVKSQQLGALLREHRSLRLLFFNVDGGNHGRYGNPSASIAQQLAQQGIPAVITMQFQISDTATIGLAYEFYAALVHGRTIDRALSEARLAIYTQDNKVAWGAPILTISFSHGRLFEIDLPQPSDISIHTPIEFDWVTIPAGDFQMGGDTIYLSEYHIAKVPVTNAQYKAFVDATGHRHPDHWRGGRIPKDQEQHPVVHVSWHDAQAFCEWAGVRLPTEAEWEKAARGEDGRRYPWGNDEPNTNLCNFDYIERDITPVDKYPEGASPYGCLDMVGNVWEWTSSLYAEYPYRADDGREDSMASGLRVLRGGSFVDRGNIVGCTYRRWTNSDPRDNIVGLRVVCREMEK